MAKSIENVHSVGFASGFTLAILLRCGDWEAGEILGQTFIDLCQTHHLDYWLVTALAHRAMWLNHTGNPDDGLVTMKTVIAAWKAAGTEIGMPIWAEYLADVLWQQQGRVAEARAVAGNLRLVY